MEALPIVLNFILPNYVAFLLSVTAVLFFGEVIPQALCTGKD
jgi:metal transporter CNNM